MALAPDYIPPVALRLGQAILLDGRTVEYRGRARDEGKRLLFMGADGVQAALTDGEALLARREGRMHLRPPLAVREDAQPRDTMDTVSDDVRDETRRRHAYVRAWHEAERPSRNAATLDPIVAHVARTLQDTSPPSPRTVLRWIANWLDFGEDVEGLVAQTGGNTTDRLDVEARELLQETVEKYYLVRTRPSGVAVHRCVRAAFQERNRALPTDDHWTVPALRTVYRQIQSIDRYTIDFSREGPRVAAHRWRPVGEGPRTERHNEVWEFDHTMVDVIVVDPVTQLPLGRPWVTIAIDRYSRVIPGFRIGFEPPSAEAVLDCIRVGVSPKDDLRQEHPTVRGPWPCFGVPEVMVTDNGREFKSRAFVDACLRLGCDVEYTPVLKPWYKGRVERFFRTLTKNIFQKVPGTTFSNMFERNREIIPERVAIVTLEKLRALTARYIIDVYHNRPHRALGDRSPLALWTESVERHGIVLPPSEDELATMTGLVVWRTPQRYGIEFEGMLYNNRAVANLRTRSHKPEAVKVRIDQRDLTRIWFIDPDDNSSLEVPLQRSLLQLMDGVTLAEHRVARALQRQNPERLAGQDGLFKAHRMLDDAMHELGGEDGRENKSKALRDWATITQPPMPEDAPAFEVGRSRRSLVEEAMNTRPDPADGPAEGQPFPAGDEGEPPIDAAARERPVVAPARTDSRKPHEAAASKTPPAVEEAGAASDVEALLARTNLDIEDTRGERR